MSLLPLTRMSAFSFPIISVQSSLVHCCCRCCMLIRVIIRRRSLHNVGRLHGPLGASVRTSVGSHMQFTHTHTHASRYRVERRCRRPTAATREVLDHQSVERQNISAVVFSATCRPLHGATGCCRNEKPTLIADQTLTLSLLDLLLQCRFGYFADWKGKRGTWTRNGRTREREKGKVDEDDIGMDRRRRGNEGKKGEQERE